jgi:hypothetical protein
MAQAKYYSPALARPLITKLYFVARAKKVPMTVLSNQLVEDSYTS